MATPVAARVRKRRDAMRRVGLRPIQLWVPDTRHRSFREECRRQSALLKNDPQEREVMSWIESVSDLPGWK